MKKVMLVSGILIATAGFAQESGPVVVNAPSNNPNQRICQAVAETGSRLGRARICRTRAEWDQERREARQNVEQSQVRNPGKQY